MRYVEARLDDTTREEAYRFFVTESLRLAPQNKYITKSYHDMVNKPVKADNRTGDEIAADVILKAGLKFGG
mgnify:CR=1 FL=1